MSDYDYFFRPPAPDEMPGQPWAPHPESVRGQFIALYLETARVTALLESTWRGRLLLRVGRLWARLRR